MSLNAIGVDIGGSKIAAAIVGSDGSVAEQMSAPTPVAGGQAAILETVIRLCRGLLETATVQGQTISAVGVGSAGHVDHERGVITYASGTLPGWAGTALAAHLQTALDLPVVVENDVNALAIGESRFGAGQSFDEALYVAIGTGVGGAIVREGRLWRGASFCGGEIGHLVVDWDGMRRCSCGLPGHLEAYTAGPALAERYRALAGLDVAPDLRVVAERARNGDVIARTALLEGARILGLALGGLLSALDPQALIIGGSVPDSGPLWWAAFETALRSSPMPGPARIALHPAQLGAHAVVIGAGWMALGENEEPRTEN
jgi:glucokinase